MRSCQQIFQTVKKWFMQHLNCCRKLSNFVKETAEVTTTHMRHIPIVVCQARGQDQLEMGDNYFSGENRISLVQASQIPVKTI